MDLLETLKIYATKAELHTFVSHSGFLPALLRFESAIKNHARDIQPVVFLLESFMLLIFLIFPRAARQHDEHEKWASAL